MLLDRHTEVRTLDRLLGDVRGGQSRALVLRGEAGVGKTQLLEYLVDRAAGFWIMRATGVQSEMRALLYNSLGRYGEAREAATRAKDNPPVMGVEPWLVLSELVEAAARSGEPDEAAEALQRLAETTQARRHRLGARCRSPMPRTGERRLGGRDALPRGDRPARPDEHPRGADACPPALRRVAAQAEPAR